MDKRRPGRGRGQRVRSVTRARLLTTAERLFFAHGFAATTVDAIAHEAGYTTGAVYSNFGGKADLFLAVLEDAAAADLAAMRAAFEAAQTDGQRLDAFGVAVSRDSERWKDRVAATIEFIGYARRYPKLRERIVASQRVADEAMADLLGHLSESLGVAPISSPDELTIVMAAVDGLSLRALVDDDLDIGLATARTINRLLAATGSGEPASRQRRKVGTRGS